MSLYFSTAMRDALEKDARIHRDLSVGNIVLVKEPGRRIRRGYLIDWESSARIDSDGDAVRTGRAVSIVIPSVPTLVDLNDVQRALGSLCPFVC